MKKYTYPNKETWSDLTKRPILDYDELDYVIKEVFKQVKLFKDQALFEYTARFDGVKIDDLTTSQKEIEEAKQLVPEDLKEAINQAKANIEMFHASQLENSQIVETTAGVQCWRNSIGIEKVGLYIPGGTAPLFSSLLMLGVPAKLAGCKEIILCTPPNSEGKIHPAILYSASILGIEKIYKVGGAQAIAAMAFGTETIPEVYKIFGPGNQFVTRAKEMAQLEGTAIDMPAGPSEVLIIADETAKPVFIAADLLSQAEHGEDSQVILLSNNQIMLEKSMVQLNIQIQQLPRKEIALKALENSRAILFETMDECFEFSNAYAPEHLIVASDKASIYTEKISSAGSVFLGNYSCESAGDYASGTNHTLPTNGFARNYSGVSIDSFVKKITFQKLSEEGLKNIGPAIEKMAEAEQLQGHKNAVSVRLKSLSNV